MHGTLKLRTPYTPYWGFVTSQPGYTGNEPLLSVLPDFIDYVSIAEKLGLVRVKYYGADGALLRVELYLAWVGESVPMTWFDRITLAHSMTDAERSTASEVALSIIGPGFSHVIKRTVPVIEDATCTVRLRSFEVGSSSIGAAHYIKDLLNPDTDILSFSYPIYPGIPGYPGIPNSLGLSGFLNPISCTFADFAVTSTGNHVIPYTYQSYTGSFTMARITGIIASHADSAISQHIHFFNPALTSLPSITNANPYGFLDVVDDFIRSAKMVAPYASPTETWPSL
jgi:hypothetical protein